MIVAWPLSDCCLTSEWSLFDLWVIVVWPLSDRCLTSEWSLFDLWVIVVWPLSDRCLTSEWSLFDLWVIVVWPLSDCCLTTSEQFVSYDENKLHSISKCNHIIIYFILYKICAFLQLSVLYTHFPFSNYWKIIFILKTTKTHT